jgi:hypothetical protein
VLRVFLSLYGGSLCANMCVKFRLLNSESHLVITIYAPIQEVSKNPQKWFLNFVYVNGCKQVLFVL